MLTDTVDMGPRPITEASLQAHTSEYLPWLYEVLGRLEQPTPIREPEPQQFASKGYIHRNLKEVSCIKDYDSYRKLI
jgi:hypothetical protein